ncbi:MAG: tRNA preQ1(34) S-adenosylmethionine ribosyltransferase-isomerase QueA [Phycisphaerae bacterium]|nr:tRNA preQ1(34) S-adenosylmethionine ribosyltransferase-isomerase QueA [Phycisphaerae bacterium]
MLRTTDLDYTLPPELVATEATEPRDAARLMVVGDNSACSHRYVRDLPDILEAGDLLILNVTRVLQARFRGVRRDSRGRVEGLYLGERDRCAQRGPVWSVLIRARRQAPGVVIDLWDGMELDAGINLTLVQRDPEEHGAWLARVAQADGSPVQSAASLLDRVGLTPVPPYIVAARKRARLAPDDARDRARYQTVYAEVPRGGSVAAPTAGLHFTPELLDALARRGVGTAPTVLHVGTGTFKEVETEFVESHPMHREWFELPAATARRILEVRARGGRIVAVGTTSARTLESCPSLDDAAEHGASGWTNLLITPGHRWAHTDALMTNFHMPRTTLLAMVAARLPGGLAQLRTIYQEAIRERYRFYSYGDAMLILPPRSLRQ